MHPSLSVLKSQLKIDHDEDDELLMRYLKNAISYAEQFQTKNYTDHPTDTMKGTTEQAIMLLVSTWYDNRDGVSYKATSAATRDPALNAVDSLLWFDRTVHI